MAAVMPSTPFMVEAMERNTFLHLRATPVEQPVIRASKTLDFEITTTLDIKIESRASFSSVSTHISPSSPNGSSRHSESEDHMVTTFLVRNIPNLFDQRAFLAKIKAFRNDIDFLYLPMDQKKGCNLGYCFINFVDAFSASEFASTFTGAKLFQQSNKRLSIEPSRTQGLAANVESFRNTAVAKYGCGPMVFRNGEQIRFPAKKSTGKKARGCSKNNSKQN